MKPAGAVMRGGLLLFLGWLYGGDVVRWGQAQAAEVAALADLPRLWLGLLGTGVALGGAVVLVMARGRPPAWRPLRLLSVAVIALLFLDFVVLNSRRSPLSSQARSQMVVQLYADAVARESGMEAVPRDPALLHAPLAGLGPVPFFARGEPVSAWKVELRERCAGPAADPGQAAPGTLIYCVSVDRKQAWVTLVGTAQGQVFGPRAVVSTGEGWVGEVNVTVPEAPEPAGPPVWESPTPGPP